MAIDSLATGIFITAKHDLLHLDIYPDLVGLGKRAFPEDLEDSAALKVADWISGYERMWHKVGNADPFNQNPIFSGLQTYYQDPKHVNRNNEVTARDTLSVFKEFERTLAYRVNSGDPFKDWIAMQVHLGNKVRADYHWARDMERTPWAR